MNSGDKQTTFQRFVAMRRRFFIILLFVSFIVSLWLANSKFDSLPEIVGFSIVSALIATVIISLACIPVVWIAAKKIQKKE